MDSPTTRIHLYRWTKRIAMPAEIPNTVSATDWHWLKYPTFTIDLVRVRQGPVGWMHGCDDRGEQRQAYHSLVIKMNEDRYTVDK